MIHYVVGNLLESPAKVLVNTVNTVGVMGKGIAKEFKEIYPAMFSEYQALCEAHLLDIGQLWLYKTPHKWILNFPTKRHWRNPSKLEYIEAGLDKFVETYADKGITSVAFPTLGCGNGELDWDSQVRPLMESRLKNLLIDVYIYIYRKDGFIPEHRDTLAVQSWLRSEPRSLAFSEVAEDLERLLEKKDTFALLNSSGQVHCYSILDTNRQSGIKFEKDGVVDIVENEQLLELWQEVMRY